MAKAKDPEEALNDLLADCYADPLKYVMSVFPWSTDESIQMVRLQSPWKERFNCEFGPDAWACEFLDALGADIKARAFNGRDAVAPIQNAIASGHGIGKSTLAAWIVKFIMDTRPFCKGTVTAMTDQQLRTKTWAAVGEWHKRSLTAHRFEFRSGRGALALLHKEHPEKWFVNGQTCREENSESFAGQHAANSTSFYLFDEASGIPGKIYEVRMGGLTDGEPMTFDFGNPTRNSGEFYNCFYGPQAHRYRQWRIDSRSVQVSNKVYIQTLMDDFGADSDRFRVRVRGEFPKGGDAQFIPTTWVNEAMLRDPYQDRHAPLVLGVDVAHYGDDDSVIFSRWGNDAKSWPAQRFSGLDTVMLVGKVIETINRFAALGQRVSMIFVDGGGLGAGVCDQLMHLGYPITRCYFGQKLEVRSGYRFSGDEMWAKMKHAIQHTLCLPDDPDLRNQLTAREFGDNDQGQIHLESKEEMKKRGVGSPDIADALALTYAFEVASGNVGSLYAPREPLMTIHQYDELAWGNR